MYLWRAVDSEGENLDRLVQSRRDKVAARRLMRKLLKKQGYAPTVLVTAKLASMGARGGSLVSQHPMSRVFAKTTGRRTPIR